MGAIVDRRSRAQETTGQMFLGDGDRVEGLKFEDAGVVYQHANSVAAAFLAQQKSVPSRQKIDALLQQALV